MVSQYERKIMKGETLIVVVALLLIGMLAIKNFLPAEEKVENKAEENKVAYRYDIEDQNFAEIDTNTVETVDSNVVVDNVIDVSAIEELRKGSN